MKIPSGGYLTRNAVDRSGPEGADAQARKFRKDNPSLFEGNDLVAGHLPDSTWTGSLPPVDFAPMTQSVNSSIGTQAKAYPYGYRNRLFVPGTWEGSNCVPTGA